MPPKRGEPFGRVRVEGRARSQAKVAGKSKAKSKAKGKGKALPAPLWVQNGNTRGKARRDALESLNAIASELGVSTVPLKASSKKVEKLLKKLDKRAGDDEIAQRIRAAAHIWTANGGQLQVALLPVGREVRDADAEGFQPAAAPIPAHKVLLPEYRLESKAFMLTCNSRSFTADTWARFARFIQTTARRIGAAAWAACLEETLTPSSIPLRGGEARQVYHVHAYFMWKDGEGIRARNTDDFLFQNTRPRVDCVRVRNPANFEKVALCVLHCFWVYASKTRNSKSKVSFITA